MAGLRYWVAAHPDLHKPIGGIKQLHRLAEALQVCGRDVALIQDNAAFHPGWFNSCVQAVSFDDFRRMPLHPSRDVVVLPETFVPAMPRYAPGISKLIFNQNGSYSFGFQPGDGFPKAPSELLQAYRHPDLRHVLCVSESDYHLLQGGFALGPAFVTRLTNPIEPLFQPASPKHRSVAWMPRKKSGRDGAIVAALLAAQSWFSPWRIQAIQGLPQPGVARVLQQSLVFFAFGFPEGFGLPLAEALACGCYLIGYSGLGGRELFALAASHGAGEEVAFGDWYGFVQALHRFHQRLDRDPQGVAASLKAASKAVRQRYSLAALQDELRAALPRWEARLA